MSTKTLIDPVLETLNLIKRHIEILNTVRKEGPIGILRLSQILGKKEHKIRYSLRVLEKEGLISASAEGAIITDTASQELKKINEKIADVADIIEKIKVLLRS